MQVKKMYMRVASQIFTWAGEEPLQIGYDGQTFVVPPRHETAKPGFGSIYRLEGARAANGDLIPGTIVVSDMDTPTEEGGRRRTLSVTDFCDYLTRDRDDLFARGFNIVGTPQEVGQAIEQGIPLYEASQDGRAREILATELERRKKFEEKGQPAPPSSSEHQVAWAIKHLRSRQVEQAPSASTDDIYGALQGRYKPDVKPAAAASLSRVTSAQEIYEEANRLGIVLSKTELAGLLGNEPEQTNFVMQKIELKRKAAAEPAPA